MARRLTHKQSEFASGVAQGMTVTSAYRKAYQPADGKAPSVYANAKRAMKHPAIAARIEELQLQLLPCPADMAQIYAHGMATIVELSISAEDARVRLRAAEWLCAEAEKREKLEEAARPRDQRDDIVGSLRELYRKALPPQDSLVEVVNDTAGDEELEGAPVGELEAPGESSGQEEVFRETAAEDVEEAGETTASAQYVMERVTPPGHFPPKFRKVLAP